MKINTDSPKLLEADIKAITLNYLREQELISENDVLISELTIANFARRADLAIFRKNGMEVFEIKSDGDSLIRLEDQIAEYLRFFDKVTVVAASRHIEKVKKITSPNVAIWEIRDSKICIVRNGKVKLAKQPEYLIQYLKSSELATFVTKEGLVPMYKSKGHLIETALQASRKAVRNAAINAIMTRYGVSSKTYHQITSGQKITLSALQTLSPFLKERMRIKNLRLAHKNFWASWCEQFPRIHDDPKLFELSKNSSNPIFGKVPMELAELLN